MCCPSCGKAGIRLVAFTDAAAVLHMIGRRTNAVRFLMNTLLAHQIPRLIHPFPATISGYARLWPLSSCPLRSPALALRGYWRGTITALNFLAQFNPAFQSCWHGNLRIQNRFPALVYAPSRTVLFPYGGPRQG